MAIVPLWSIDNVTKTNMDTGSAGVYLPMLTREMTMNKNEIDKQAEREAVALAKAGRQSSANYKRTRQADDYNRSQFDRLFAKEK